jgi:UDP-N-acetylglucosamine:LPS N-acetylglucosamine transferase
LRPAFHDHHVVWVTVSDAYREHVPGAPLRVIADTTRWNKVGALRTAAQVLRILLEERPDVVVSTGALPGFFGVLLGKRLGARTIWVDSLANVEELSMSGQRAGKHADLWLTQWPELARDGGPCYAGNVLT